MAIKESHIEDVDTDAVPKYEPSRPYPVLEPSYEDVVIRLDEVEKIAPDTVYDKYSLQQTFQPSLPDQPPPLDLREYRITTTEDFRITSDGHQREIYSSSIV